MHTPSSPVNLAWAEAMKAAISSCRTWTNSILSFGPLQRAEHAVDAVARDSRRCGARPSACSRSKKKSPTVCAMPKTLARNLQTACVQADRSH